MKKIILLLLISYFAFSQNRTGHNHISLVSQVNFNEDFSQFITRNDDEIGYWDMTSTKPIWVFETKNFGCSYTTGASWFLKTHDNLNYIALESAFCQKIIDVKKLTYNPLPYQPLYNIQIHWVNGKAMIIEKNSSKDKLEILYYEPNSTQKKSIIKGKTLDLDYVIYKDKIFIANKSKNKTTRYDIKTEKWDDFSLDFCVNNVTENYYQYKVGSDSFVFDINTGKSIKIDLGSYEIGFYKLRENEFCLVNVDKREAFFYDILSGNKTKIAFNLVHQNNLSYANHESVKFVDYDAKNKRLLFIENEYTKINTIGITKSFLSSYDKNGNHIASILLTETNNEMIAAIDKQAAIELEKRRLEDLARSTPENIMRNRLIRIYNEKYFNTTNKRIYQVVPDKPIFEGNLVRLNALHHDKTKTEEVYEKIDNLEDETKYKLVTKFGKCYVCNGEGVTHKNGKQTVADYEYTLGVKVVKTTSTSTGCQHCGGCGLLPL